MVRVAVIGVMAILGGVCLAGTDELGVAKSALRDELWDVARNHAEKAEGPEARLVKVESLAREGKWEEVVRTLAAYADDRGDGFIYYRALAAARLGKTEAAFGELADHDFKEEAYRRRGLLLRAELARLADRPDDVLKLSADSLFPADDVDARMLVAWAKERTGSRSAAERIWHDVLACDQAGDKALAAAATNLGDIESLRTTMVRLESAPLRRAVGLRLGCALLADDKTFAEGEKTIRFLAKDAPDSDGARAAFVKLCDALLKRGRFADSAEAYRKALEAWPEAARDLPVQEGYGWALRKAGRPAEALTAFIRAEEVATNATDKARMLLAQGDVHSELGAGGEAMSVYRKVLEKYPETPSGEKLKVVVELREMETEGRTLYEAFRFSEAQAKFAELARRDSERRPRMEYLEMLCLYGRGRDDEAAEKAADIAANSPDATIRAEATLWLAKLSFNARRWREACGLFVDYATNRAPTSVQAPSALIWAARASFAARDYLQSVNLVTLLLRDHADAPEKASAWLVQGEALIELARLDEAILVLEKVVQSDKATPENRFRARRLKADVLFVMGADNPARYIEARDGYRELQLGESLTPDDRLALSFKIGRTLEKLGQMDEAIDQYYSEVIHAYRDGREKGLDYDEESMAMFSRAAFRLADEFEQRGEDQRARRVLRLVVKSDVVTAHAEAERRLARLQMKGTLQ